MLALAKRTTIDGVNYARSEPPGLVWVGGLPWLASGFVGMTAWLGDAGVVLFLPAAAVMLVAVAAARWVARRRLAWQVDREIDLEACRGRRGLCHCTEPAANTTSKRVVQKLSSLTKIVCKNVRNIQPEPTMLLEFRIRNFRSIKDEQSLSLVAAPADKELAETHLAPTGLKALPQAVRSAVLYGPNASGKSTLLFALNYLRAMVAESATVVQPGQTYNVQPFRLDPATASQPTEFEASFLVDGIRHQYSFAMTADRIVGEQLMVWRTAKPTQWFSRRLDDSGERYVYEFSAYLTGPRKLWQESTRPNALFLSTAAQLNSELLGPVARWLVQGLVYLPAGAFIDHAFTTALLESKEGRAAVRDFLATADISIAEVSAVPRKGLLGQVMFQPGGVAQARQEEGEFLFPIFEHRTEQGSAKFELHEESEGTQRLFSLAAPVLDVLKHGRVLVVDELDRSLHTLLVRRLVGMFHDPVLNPRGAQLVFSTHDTSLLDHTLFRRDQVWFAEKDGTQATRIFPLSDFSPRKYEAWERGYLMGRYGAVPMFSALPQTASSVVAPSAPSAPGSPVTV